MGTKQDTSFATRLKTLMDGAERTQADLVKTGIISKSYLSGILSGKHPAPDVSIIRGISRALRLDSATENELILLAGREFAHILANEAAADFLRKTVENGWDQKDWEKHNQIVDLVIQKKGSDK